MLRFGLPGPTENFKIVCYNDSSLGTLKNGGSQGGFIIYLDGENNVSSPIMRKSKKLRRVVKSAMATKNLIQVEATEACFWLTNLLSEMLYCKPNDNKNIKIERDTDNHQLYDSVYSTRPIQDKRLRTEIALLSKMINKKEITKINWIENKHQIADCLTIYGASSEKLLNNLKTKSIEVL